jgi:hypothetical protein
MKELATTFNFGLSQTTDPAWAGLLFTIFYNHFPAKVLEPAGSYKTILQRMTMVIAVRLAYPFSSA